MPVFSRALEKTLRKALAIANERRHEYATLEHLLLGLADDSDAATVLRACGVDLDKLRSDLGEFLDKDLAGLMHDAGSGLLVTMMFGPSLNSNTGDWSIGVSGFWFDAGEIAYPVTEITVAGNLVDIYARVVIGSDLEIRGASNAPSLLIDNLAIAGR